MFTTPVSTAIVFLLSAHLSKAIPHPGDAGTDVLNLARRGFRTNSPVGADANDAVFDPTYSQGEIERIFNKYRGAEQILHNVDMPPAVEQQYQMAHTIEEIIGANVTVPDPDTDVNGHQGAASANAANVPLIDDISGTLDVLYYGPVQFGTGNQRLTVDIDTGSADLWVPVGCTSCAHPSYSAQSSSSYRNTGRPFSVTYGSGQVSGDLAQDRVTIGGLVVDTQYFGAVNKESEDFANSPNDGLIGMAFSSIASSRQRTFFENLIASNSVAAPLFSVHLTRGQTRGSQLCLGCYDGSKARGDLTWVPVTSQTYWAVTMPGVVINGKVATGSKGQVTAAIDTGTTLIYFPQALAQAFYSQIPGATPADQYGEGFYTFPCNSRLTISLMLGPSTYALNTVDFNLGRTSRNSNTCVGGILAMGGNFPADLAIIGDEFLKSWYSVYDYSHGARVGFAPSINNS